MNTGITEQEDLMMQNEHARRLKDDEYAAVHRMERLRWGFSFAILVALLSSVSHCDSSRRSSRATSRAATMLSCASSYYKGLKACESKRDAR